MTERKTEDVTNGHTVIGRIISRDRGFECFTPDGRYLFTDPTLAGARKAIFQHFQGDNGQSRRVAEGR